MHVLILDTGMMYLFILIIRYTQTFEGIPVIGGDIVMKFKGRTLKSTHGKVTNLARSRIGNEEICNKPKVFSAESMTNALMIAQQTYAKKYGSVPGI